jgi:hypothetical protein
MHDFAPVMQNRAKHFKTAIEPVRKYIKIRLGEHWESTHAHMLLGNAG